MDINAYRRAIPSRSLGSELERLPTKPQRTRNARNRVQARTQSYGVSMERIPSGMGRDELEWQYDAK